MRYFAQGAQILLILVERVPSCLEPQNSNRLKDNETNHKAASMGCELMTLVLP